MSHNYNTLQKRLKSLSKNENKSVWYSLDIMTDYNYQGEKLYQTPDSALLDIYADAHGRKATYIAVTSYPFNQGNIRGEDIGFVWNRRKGGTLTITPESEGTSFVYILGDYGTCCRELSYPSAKPEKEFLNILLTEELDWIQHVAGCSTVEQFIINKKRDNPELYPPDWQTDTQKLIRLYNSHT